MYFIYIRELAHAIMRLVSPKSAEWASYTGDPDRADFLFKGHQAERASVADEV